jgi:hypothetical protein
MQKPEVREAVLIGGKGAVEFYRSALAVAYDPKALGPMG